MNVEMLLDESDNLFMNKHKRDNCILSPSGVRRGGGFNPPPEPEKLL